MSWNVHATAFIVLVAVWADYNLLLITRIREESRTGIRSGIIHAVRSAGAVITSAGIIFAASMFGLLFGSLSTMVQTGFIIGMGLFIDTFVVRTVTVRPWRHWSGMRTGGPPRKLAPPELLTQLTPLRALTPRAALPNFRCSRWPKAFAATSLIGCPPTTSVVPRPSGGGQLLSKASDLVVCRSRARDTRAEPPPGQQRLTQRRGPAGRLLVAANSCSGRPVVP